MEKLTDWLRLRVGETEIARYRQAARTAGMKLSPWVRYTLLKAINSDAGGTKKRGKGK